MSIKSKFGWQVLISIFIILLKLHCSESNPAPLYNCVNLDGGLTCHSSDPNPYRNYGSETAYPAVHKDYTKTYDLKGCTPKVFYLLNRHATRYPGKDCIEYINERLPILKEKIISSYQNGQAKMCQDDINKLMDWSPTLAVEDELRLSATGAAEAEELGERLRQRFPEILGMKYSPGRFIIEYTEEERTRDTAQNFSRGLFTEQDYEKVKGKINQKLIRFNKECKKMMNKCDNQKLDLKEIKEFLNGSLMQKTIESASKRVGFTLTNDDMIHMHTACSFGYALNISDAWCAVFSHDDLKVMEYGDDIQWYYRRSYGNVVNYQQACPIIKYIVDLFKSYERTRMSKIVLQFGHSGALSRFFTAIGISRNDKKLTAKSFCSQSNRRWRASSFAPFNTNIAFVLYDCNGDLKIMTLHNEMPVRIDGCKNDKLCSLKEFYDNYLPLAENCDLEKICDVCRA